MSASDSMRRRGDFFGVGLAVALIACLQAAAGAQATIINIDIAKNEVGASPENDRFPLAIYKAASPKDVEVSLRLKVTAGKQGQGGGVAMRLMSPDNYYLVQLDALRDRVVFSRVTDGVFEEVAGVDADITSRTWHRLEVRARDHEFLVSLNGAWIFTVFDKTLPHPGRVALWTKGDSVTRFDSITITPLTVSEQRY
jgi:hypothetical protein